MEPTSNAIADAIIALTPALFTIAIIVGIVLIVFNHVVEIVEDICRGC